MHFQTIGNSLRIRFLAENAYFCDIFTGILCFNRYHRVSSGNNFTNNISTKVKARCLFNSGCCRASNNNFVLFFISSSPIISLILNILFLFKNFILILTARKYKKIEMFAEA